MKDWLKIYVIHGPNLNLLGRREPEIYGKMTLREVNQAIIDHAKNLNCRITSMQSNSEGCIIDSIHRAIDDSDGIIINPGAYTHYSYAIYDAILASELPTIEIHISDINSREEFRKVSIIKPACIEQISGLGWQGYLTALEHLIKFINSKN